MRLVGLRVLIVASVPFIALSMVRSVTAHQNNFASSSGKKGITNSSVGGGAKNQVQMSSDRSAGLAMPPGGTAEMVALGFQLFHGESGGVTCYTCHGVDAKGTVLAPDLTANKWLWSDGS